MGILEVEETGGGVRMSNRYGSEQVRIEGFKQF